MKTVHFISVCVLITVATGLIDDPMPVACYEGWLPFGNSCYLFKDSVMTFPLAQNYCSQYGGHLVHVNDAQENAFIKGHLRKFQSNHWLLGLMDNESENAWTWSDTHTVAEYTDFHSGDPGTHAQEDCAILASSYNYQWADVLCSRQFFFICEMQALSCGASIIG